MSPGIPGCPLRLGCVRRTATARDAQRQPTHCSPNSTVGCTFKQNPRKSTQNKAIVKPSLAPNERQHALSQQQPSPPSRIRVQSHRAYFRLPPRATEPPCVALSPASHKQCRRTYRSFCSRSESWGIAVLLTTKPAPASWKRKFSRTRRNGKPAAQVRRAPLAVLFLFVIAGCFAAPHRPMRPGCQQRTRRAPTA